MTDLAPARGRARLAEVAALAAASVLVALAVARPVASPPSTALAAASDEAPPNALSPRWLLPIDDAYIFIRYAQQAARGHPLQWSTGEVSTGASSFLFPWLLVPGQWLFDDLAGWSTWSRWIGVASLFSLGLAGALVLRTAGFTAPWPLVGGLVPILSGPLVYGSLAGMESALNAAGVLCAAALCSRLWRPTRPAMQRRGLAIAALGAVALLPWLRPENVVLTALAAVAVALARPAVLPRSRALVILVPGALMVLLYALAAGQPLGAGAVTKSILSTPYAGLGVLARFVALNWRLGLGPTYLGLEPHLLAPAVGALAVAGALLASRPRFAGLRPLAAAWAVLLLLAPFSTILMWQYGRHHHAGLACALLLATAALAAFVERLAPRLRWLALLVPLALAADLPYWRDAYARGVLEIGLRHGPAVAWLEEHAHDEVLVVNDAGLPALAHDGPMIDVMGLGTPAMSLPHRHGAGSVVEALARRPRLPDLAAANLDVFRVPEILGPRLLPQLDPRRQTVLARVRTELLQGTVLDSEGVDLACLASEAGARLRWDPEPLPLGASVALVLDDGGVPTAQGCRPLRGSLTVEVPAGRPVRLRATSLAGVPAAIRASFGGPLDPSPVRLELLPGRWSDSALGAASTHSLRLDVLPGPPACLEAIVWERSGTGTN